MTSGSHQGMPSMAPQTRPPAPARNAAGRDPRVERDERSMLIFQLATAGTALVSCVLLAFVVR